MNSKLIVYLFVAIVVALVIVVSLARITSAHQYNEGNEGFEFREHYSEMLDLHKQYFNNEISFEELWESMENDEFHYEYMPCHQGYGMMGYHMMGMM